MFNSYQSINPGETNFAPIQNMQMVNKSKRAVLWIFSPKYIPDMCRRSYSYHFGPEFENACNDKITNTRMSFNRTMDVDSQVLAKSITPSSTGTRVALDQLSGRYTFLLQVEDKPMGNAFIASISYTNLYSGYIEGEPLSHGFVMGSANSVNPNPDATFIVTHSTDLSVDEITDANGSSFSSATNETDFIPVLPAVQLTADKNNNDVSDLRPDTLVAKMPSSTCEPDVTLAAPSRLIDNLSDPNTTSIAVNTDLNNPISHINFIASTLNDAASITMANQNSFSGLGIQALGDDMLTNSFVTSLSSKSRYTTPRRGSIDPGRPFTFKELTEKYPDLNVLDVTQPSQSAIQFADPFSPTPQNVLTTVLSNCLPSLLSKYSIADLAFNYASFRDDDELIRSGIHGRVEFTNMVPLYNMDSVTYANNLRALKITLARDIMPLLLNQGCGDIYCLAECSLGGETHINLQMMDYNNNDSGITEVSNRLGGFYSPMIGSATEAVNNQVQLSNLVTDISRTNALSTNQYDVPGF